MPELSFCTTQELIEELLRRRTFLGVVVHSEEELRGTWSDDRTFKVRFNANLDAGQASRLLETVAEYIDLNHG